MLNVDGFRRNYPGEGSADVGIVMGSWSDWGVMEAAWKVLDELGVRIEAGVISAHRTPHLIVEYAERADLHTFSAIVAGAGGAAHLPGMLAAFSSLIPVIGVPVKTSTLNGVDSLYSIVQMPPGIPVSTVAINGAQNAGILAAQIHAGCARDRLLKDRIRGLRSDLARMVEENPDPSQDPR